MAKKMKIFIVLTFSLVLLISLMTVGAAFAATASPEGAVKESGSVMGDEARGKAFIAIALSIGMGCLAAGFAVGKVGSAAIGAATEKPEIFGKAIIFVGLAEGVAIYGLIVAIMIFGKV